MNNLMIFEGNKVEIITGVDGEPLFEIYSTGMALGYINKRKNSTGKEYISPYKSRIDKIIESAEITCVCQGVTQYLTEEQLYDFMLEARTEKCKTFRKWVTNEVLPSIRKNGGYITTTDDMSDEEIMSRALEIARKTLEAREQRIREQQIELDRSKEFYSIKRVALINNISHKDLNWRELKRMSAILDKQIIKIFDANYGQVNTYHKDVFKAVYPQLEL